MRPLTCIACLAALVLVVACDDEGNVATPRLDSGPELDRDAAVRRGCTDILLLPIAVTIEPRDLSVDSVTSHNEGEKTVDCQRGFRSRTMFSCREQGAGRYTVQVTSGELTWTQSVELHADECHVTDTAQLTFDLDPATAD